MADKSFLLQQGVIFLLKQQNASICVLHFVRGDQYNSLKAHFLTDNRQVYVPVLLLILLVVLFI